MVSRGLCSSDRDAVSGQVESIMKFNDESFDAMRRVVAKHEPVLGVKVAGRVPQVGLTDSGAGRSADSDVSLVDALNAAFSKSTKRTF